MVVCLQFADKGLVLTKYIKVLIDLLGKVVLFTTWRCQVGAKP